MAIRDIPNLGDLLIVVVLHSLALGCSITLHLLEQLDQGCSTIPGMNKITIDKMWIINWHSHQGQKGS
jgi:hypothetical protein